MSIFFLPKNQNKKFKFWFWSGPDWDPWPLEIQSHFWEDFGDFNLNMFFAENSWNSWKNIHKICKFSRCTFHTFVFQFSAATLNSIFRNIKLVWHADIIGSTPKKRNSLKLYINRLKSEKFKKFHFQAQIVIFEGKSLKW